MSQLGQYSPKSPRNNIFLLITVFLALGFVAGGFWAFQKLTDNGVSVSDGEDVEKGTSGQTGNGGGERGEGTSEQPLMHSNNTYGIEVSYPPSWQLKEDSRDYPASQLTGQKVLFQILSPDEGEKGYRENILVKIEERENTPYLDEYADTQRIRIKQLGTFGVEEEDSMEIGSSGQRARKIVYSGNDGQHNLKRQRIIVLPKTKPDSKLQPVLLITYTADFKDYDQYLPEVEKILESIQLN